MNKDHTEQLDQWGYFRPGYFPVQEDSIAPAMICLGEDAQTIQFVLVKADCYLKVWEDALFVSETDYEEAQKNNETTIDHLMQTFMDRGYLPIKQIKPEVQFLGIH